MRGSRNFLRVGVQKIIFLWWGIVKCLANIRYLKHEIFKSQKWNQCFVKENAIEDYCTELKCTTIVATCI